MKTSITKSTKRISKPKKSTTTKTAKSTIPTTKSSKAKTAAKPKLVKSKAASKAGKKKVAKAKTAFELRAPEAGMVFLAGTFNNWDPSRNPMTKTRNGIWKSAVELAPGKYEYLFVVDGRWTFDPAATQLIPNPFGSSNCLKLVA